jgi:ferredoxin
MGHGNFHAGVRMSLLISRNDPYEMKKLMGCVWDRRLKNQRRHPAAIVRQCQPAPRIHLMDQSRQGFPGCVDHGGSGARPAGDGHAGRSVSRPPVVQYGLPNGRGARFLLQARMVPPANRGFHLRRLFDVRARLPGPVHRFPDFRNRRIDHSRCVMCLDCVTSCKRSGIHLKAGRNSRSAPLVSPSGETPLPSLKRRDILTGIAILPAAALSKPQPANAPHENRRAVLPPGAGSLATFQNLCTACQLCVANCPDQVLRPSITRHGLTGFLQPHQDFNVSFCSYNCSNCSQICPTGAIRPITVEQRRLVRTGIAEFFPDLCIVKTKGTSCGACNEHCPTQAVRMVPWAWCRGKTSSPFPKSIPISASAAAGASSSVPCVLTEPSSSTASRCTNARNLSILARKTPCARPRRSFLSENPGHPDPTPHDDCRGRDNHGVCQIHFRPARDV